MCTNYRAPHEDYELRELKIQPFSDLYRDFPWKPEIYPDYLAPIVPRLPGLFVRRLQAEHARRDAVATAHVLAELRHEAVRTRRLLWACAASGLIIGAGFVYFMH